MMRKSENYNAVSRRAFMGTITGTAAMALIGLDRRAIAGNSPRNEFIIDYIGRLCYNENPLGPSPFASEAIRMNACMAHRYHDWYAESLRLKLATLYRLTSDRVICGAGATEILRLCALAFSQPGGNVVVPNPSYGQFPADVEFTGSSVRYVNLDSNYRVNLQDLFENVDQDTTAVCITNPNNPTATIINSGKLEDFVDNLPSQVVTIIDEAYFEFISDRNKPSALAEYLSAVELVRSGKNVVVVKTFSKVYGLAGARIGYAIGSVESISLMRVNQLYATISRHSLEAAKVSLQDNQHVENTVDLAAATKSYCFDRFDQMGLEYIPSETNFFMVDVGRSADPVRSQLANRGIYVRTGWGMPNHLRVSTGTKDEMIDFTDALEDILNRMPDPRKTDDFPELPVNVELYQAYPNPFNSSTSIRVLLPEETSASLKIFDIRGRIVKTLVNRILGAGEHLFIWDGTNQSGRSVASGSYFYRLTSGENAITRKMLLLK